MLASGIADLVVSIDGTVVLKPIASVVPYIHTRSGAKLNIGDTKIPSGRVEVKARNAQVGTGAFESIDVPVVQCVRRELVEAHMKVIYQRGGNDVRIANGYISAVTRPKITTDWNLIPIIVGKVLPVIAHKEADMFPYTFIHPLQCLSDEKIILVVHVV